MKLTAVLATVKTLVGEQLKTLVKDGRYSEISTNGQTSRKVIHSVFRRAVENPRA
jgi:hypothetical protein